MVELQIDMHFMVDLQIDIWTYKYKYIQVCTSCWTYHRIVADAVSQFSRVPPSPSNYP